MLVESNSECGCELHMDAGQVVRVDTCPVCLPAGAITWLIENGRQLELFPEGRVDAGHERNAPTDRTDRSSIEKLSEISQRVVKSLVRRLE